MTTLFQLNASIFAEDGQSSKLANHFVSAWRDNNADAELVFRDLAQEPVPHLDEQRFLSFLSDPKTRTAEQQAIVDYSDTLINELVRADILVLALPLYNLGIPSTLKAYFDHIARSGITFRYTEKGPIGLLKDKPVYIFAARGGNYAGSPLDTQTPHVKHFLRLLGITNVEFVYAEGLNKGDESKAQALSEATTQMELLLAEA